MASVNFFSVVLLTLVLDRHALAADSGWKMVKWHDETAWESVHDRQLAVVSETRSRLIYLGPADRENNLLSAPLPLENPSQKVTSPNWGGHRFWLGPQSIWSWPPPKDWEYSAAAAVKVEGAKLLVQGLHSEARFPALAREYAWEGSRLKCTVRWRGGNTPYYGMHVIAVSTPAEIEAQLFPWSRVPQGVVGVHGDQPNVVDPLPHPAVKQEGNRVLITSGTAVAKLGFYPQTLRIRRGEWTLWVLPGPTQGIAVESPDHGYVSQVWVGGGDYRYAELEQLTPFLLPDKEGWCGSTIYLEAKSGH